MPMHPSLTRLDATMICNNVRLRLGRVYEDMDRDLDRAAIAEVTVYGSRPILPVLMVVMVTSSEARR